MPARRRFRIGEAAARGVVHFRGPSVIPGYCEDEGATAEAISSDGWLAAGDMGYLDDEGHISLAGRKTDDRSWRLQRLPREVEEMLDAHPTVHEAAVTGCPTTGAARRSLHGPPTRRFIANG